ncbi:MAG: hypothetical protein ACLFVT_04670 [Syntrophobacteria bacterium]
MFSFERRKFIRLPKKFRAKVKIPRTAATMKGVTENLCQRGAFISSGSVPVCQQNDEALVELFLPPEMTGHRDVLILEGMAVIKRIEKEKKGIAVEFHKELRTFKPSR